VESDFPAGADDRRRHPSRFSVVSLDFLRGEVRFRDLAWNASTQAA
jgi:hypothetical protein